MASTVIANIVEPHIFLQYVQYISTQLSTFWTSGIVQNNEQFNAIARQGGRTFTMPAWDDLATTEPNRSHDSGTAVPLNIAAFSEVAAKQYRNQVWGAMDLVASVAGSDPMMAIARRVGTYWARVMQDTLISVLKGVLADNEANDSGDMLNDIYSDVAPASITSANLIGPEAIIDTAATMGDMSENVVAMAMHSVPYHRLQKLDLIEYRSYVDTVQSPDAIVQDANAFGFKISQQTLQIPFYLGKRVIVLDSMPTAAGSSGGSPSYLTVLFAPGAIAHGEGTPRVPIEIERDAKAGTGGGEEILAMRREFILHPRGISWQDSSISSDGTGPKNSDLELEANWDRPTAIDRNSIRIAYLRSNG